MFHIVLFLLFLVFTCIIYFGYYNGDNNDNRNQQPNVKCNIKCQKLTYIFDKHDGKFKIHGLWPNFYNNCKPITYRQYTEPRDPSNFIEKNWFKRCGSEQSLFKYEYEKHGRDYDLDADGYLNLVVKLHDKYKKNLTNKCEGYDQLWINLDKNTNYLYTSCM